MLHLISRVNSRLNRTVLFTAVFSLIGFNPPYNCASAQTAKSIWFAPRDYISYPGYPGTADFMSLFQASAAWPHAAASVTVFKLNELFIYNATDSDLTTIFANLKQRNIAVAIEAGMITDTTVCGKVEGYRCTTIGDSLSRIKALGGNLQYVAMDEPAFFGHFSPQAGAWQGSFDTIAQNVATNVAAVHQYFPNAQIGDIEPIIGSDGPSDYVTELVQWAGSYSNATGLPLAFFHADINWMGSGGWESQLQQVASLTHSSNMPLGIIYNGTSKDLTAVQWMTDAQNHYITIQTGLKIIPDQAIFQTWDPEPNHVLPEIQTGTMTNLVDRYLMLTPRTTTSYVK